MRVSVMVAMDRRGLIGDERGLPWHLPRDLRRFRELTLGKPIIMGRTTHEHVGRPLPGRENIVLSRRPGLELPGCTVARSLEEALRCAAASAEEAFVIGGGEVYREALPRADRVCLTLVDGVFAGTTYFPREKMQAGRWVETRRELCEADEKNAFCHLFLELERFGTARNPPRGQPFDLEATLAAPFTAFGMQSS
jgi:dihydrofolate reductase